MNITQQEIGWVRVWTCICLMWVIASSYPGLGYWSLFKSVERNEQFSWAVSLSLFKKTNQKSPRNGIEMMERVSHNRQLVDPIWTSHLQPHLLVLINEGTWVSFLQGTKRGKHLLCTAYWNLLWHNIPQLQISLVSKPRDILWLLGTHWKLTHNSHSHFTCWKIF